MLPTDRSNQLLQVPLQHLLPDLIRQFNKPTLFGKHGIDLSKPEMDAIAEAVANHDPLPEKISALNDALSALIQESVVELQTRFNLTFAESLAKTNMSEMGGWKTTAEFLEIANHKANAELRISAGTSLMVFLGDVRHVDTLFTVIEQDNGLDDVDAMIAKRALAHHTRIAIDSENWDAQVKQALKI